MKLELYFAVAVERDDSPLYYLINARMETRSGASRRTVEFPFLINQKNN